ncbi:MAG: hypothetical protein PHU34_08525 [Candidatus Methanoperedens sp.]|nr:hypothetical protein [Candidatus Methanoperedens sp.]
MPLWKGGRGYEEMPSSMSEADLFKTLLKKKPEAQMPQVAQKPQVPLRREAVKPVPPAQPAEIYEKKEPVIEKPQVKPVDIEPVAESIKNLTASVNLMYGLIKTVIVPVLVLILIVGIAILVKSSK